MAASGYTPILLYASGTTTNVPLAANMTSSASGAELALNYFDGKLFYKDASGNVQVLASKAGNINVSSLSFGTTGLTPSTATTGAITVAGVLNVSNGGTGQTTFTAGQVLYGNGTSGLSTSANMTFDGSTLTTLNTAYTGTLTGGTGIVNLGSGQFYKDASGNVGIGTSTPYSVAGYPSLTINGSSGGQIVLQSAGTSVGFIYTNTNLLSIDASGASSITRFVTNSAERMRINSSGNLSIGTTINGGGITMYNYSTSWETGSIYQFNYPSGNVFLHQASVPNQDNWFGLAPDNCYATTTGSANLLLSAGNLNVGDPCGNYVGSEVTSTNTSALTFGRVIGGNPIGSAGYKSEYARFDSSGNVGIGTSSPNFAGVSKAVTLNTTNGSSGAIYEIGINGTDYAYLFANTSNTVLSSVQSLPLLFNTGNTERMRIDSSGNLLVGTTTSVANTKFTVAAGNGLSALSSTNTSGTALYYAAAFYNNGTSYSYCGGITVSGSTTTYATSSDYRLKDNIAPMTGALDKVSALKPCTYSWKSDGSAGQGFIAHELQAVLPDCVIGEKDAVNEDGSIKPQCIDTSFLVATLTAAIQEQQALITDLQARLTKAGL